MFFLDHKKRPVHMEPFIALEIHVGIYRMDIPRFGTIRRHATSTSQEHGSFST